MAGRTWNAIGKASGAWQLSAGADESRQGFLFNHLLWARLPEGAGRVANADPVTDQAGWYDVRVRLCPCAPDEAQECLPQPAPVPAPPGVLGLGAALRLMVGRFAAGRRP